MKINIDVDGDVDGDSDSDGDGDGDGDGESDGDSDSDFDGDCDEDCGDGDGDGDGPGTVLTVGENRHDRSKIHGDDDFLRSAERRAQQNSGLTDGVFPHLLNYFSGRSDQKFRR